MIDHAECKNSVATTAATTTALVLLVPSVDFMLVIERLLKVDILAKVGG